MREQRYGRIINVSSNAWRRSTGHVNYAAAKGGVVSLTRSIAMEMGKYGVTANCFVPVAATRMTLTEEVRLGMQKRVEQGLMTQEQLDEMIRNMPAPEYIPPLIVYLASAKAANINSKVFHIEKGRVAIYSDPIEEKAIYKTEAGGMWTVEELEQAIPNTLLVDYINPAPSQEAGK
jgi:3-oxoacyl-[acyl-carrier protein] reductase